MIICKDCSELALPGSEFCAAHTGMSQARAELQRAGRVMASVLELLQPGQAVSVVRDAEIDEGGRAKRVPWLVHVRSEDDPGYMHTGPKLLAALERAHARMIAGAGATQKGGN